MNFVVPAAKVFAVLSLIFVNSILISGQSDSIYRLKKGTRIRLAMTEAINSSFSTKNDTFTARLSRPIMNDNVVVVPVGTVLNGSVESSRKAGTGGRNGKIELRFRSILLDEDYRVQIDGRLTDLFKKRPRNRLGIAAILGGAGAGAIIGSVSGINNGALIGAGIGTAAGTGGSLLMTGKNVGFKKDEELEIELKEDVTLPVRDY
ncbi:MAG: hypothetical protein ACT4O9_06870 [Blastocatellia bacterium]